MLFIYVFKRVSKGLTDSLTVGKCCLGGFRRAFLSVGHRTSKRESVVGEPPNPAWQYVQY